MHRVASENPVGAFAVTIEPHRAGAECSCTRPAVIKEFRVQLFSTAKTGLHALERSKGGQPARLDNLRCDEFRQFGEARAPPIGSTHRSDRLICHERGFRQCVKCLYIDERILGGHRCSISRTAIRAAIGRLSPQETSDHRRARSRAIGRPLSSHRWPDGSDTTPLGRPSKKPRRCNLASLAHFRRGAPTRKSGASWPNHEVQGRHLDVYPPRRRLGRRQGGNGACRRSAPHS